MKRILILLLSLLAGYPAQAQKAFTVSKDPENGAVVLKGPISFADLREEPSFTWLPRGETAYHPDSNAVNVLRRNLSGYDIVVLMGTWCDDSQNLVPKLSRTLQAAYFPMQHCMMYGVDRDKESGGPEKTRYNLKRVPTIIVYKGDTEVGRIVESVKESIEADLAKIVR